MGITGFLRTGGPKAAVFAAAVAFAAAPAAATIQMVKVSAIQGDNVLFVNGDQTGTTIVGETQKGLQWSFNANGAELNGKGGQSTVSGALNLGTQQPNDTIEITSLSMFRTDGGFVRTLEFNLFKGSASTVSFAVLDNLGNTFNFANESLAGGGNFFGFRGIDGQSIARIALSFDRGGIDNVKQVRIDGTTSGIVPEPESWALLIAGFGMIGLTMRGRRRTSVAA